MARAEPLVADPATIQENFDLGLLTIFEEGIHTSLSVARGGGGGGGELSKFKNIEMERNIEKVRGWGTHLKLIFFKIKIRNGGERSGQFCMSGHTFFLFSFQRFANSMD